MSAKAPNLQASAEAGGLADRCRRILEIGASSRAALFEMTGNPAPQNEVGVDLPGQLGTIETLLIEVQDQSSEINDLTASLQRRL